MPAASLEGPAASPEDLVWPRVLRRLAFRILLFVGTVLVVLFVVGCTETTPQPADDATNAVVEWVIDGDTIDVFIGDDQERVRLLGIDAPESVDPNRPEQCFGKQASDWLRELLAVGTPVLLVRDQDPRDRFGRLLAYVYLPGATGTAAPNRFVNAEIVEQGLADVLLFEPNMARARELREARMQAQDASAGLWGACDGPDQALVPEVGTGS